MLITSKCQWRDTPSLFLQMSIYLIFQLPVCPSWNMQRLAWCTQQRQNVAKADLKHLGAGDHNSVVLQLTITCHSKLPEDLSALCVCWRMDMGTIYSCHNYWKEDFLIFTLCKATSDFPEIFGSFSTAFRDQYFALCKVTAWNSVRCERQIQDRIKTADEGRFLFTGVMMLRYLLGIELQFLIFQKAFQQFNILVVAKLWLQII